MSLLNVAGFSTVCSSGPTADNIHDNAVVSAAAVISDFKKHFCFCCYPYCVGGNVVTFIPAVACVPAVVSSHDISVILVAGATLVACSVTAVACFQTVEGILAVAGILLVPDWLLLLVSLLLLAFLVLLGFLRFLSNLLLLAVLFSMALLLLLASLLILASLF